MPIARGLAFSLLLAPALACAEAGRFVLAVGEVTVQRAGQVLRAELGTPVEAGDTVRLGAQSNAQIRLSDESLVGLRSGTEFRIDEYAFEGPEDKNSRSLFSLLKGGLRTVTGLIGRLQNRDRYAVRTPTSTVGIRGTHYTLLTCANDCGTDAKNGDYGGVSDGRIGVANNTPEKVFGASEFFYVADANTPPQGLIGPPPFLYDRLEGRTRTSGQQGSESSEQMAQSGLNAESRSGEAPTPPAPNPFVATEQKTPQGDPTVVPAAAPSTAAASVPGFAPGVVTGLAVLSVTAQPHAVGAPGLHTAECDDGADCDGGRAATKATFDASGFKRVDISGGGFVDRNLATTAEVASVTGVIEWGRWTGGPTAAGGWFNNLAFGENQGFHYLVGVPPAPMPGTGSATFSLLGATRPTFSDGVGGGLGTGTMTAGSANVNFVTGVITANMSLTFNGASGASNYGLAMTNAAFTPGTAGIAGSGNLSFNGGAVNVCGEGCNTTFRGFFAGPNASHVGLGYDATANTPTVFYINGVAVMKR